VGLTYDDQHQRLTQTNTVSGTSTTKTVYINDAASGAMSERVTDSGTTPTVWNSFNWNAAPWGGVTASALPTFTDYITIDGQVVAQRKVTYPLASAWGLQNWNGFTWGAPAGSLWGSAAGANPPRFKWGTDPWSGNVVAWNYFNLDHLGSVAVITDQGGNVLQRLSYDAWGKARNANGSSANCGTITSTTTKGFTNQEMMPTQCLVNLNARLYDASIGKFMAADTMVPDPYNGQAYNRYAYVTNNPLSFTDPSGHAFGPPPESVTSTAGRLGPALIGTGGLNLSVGGGAGYSFGEASSGGQTGGQSGNTEKPGSNANETDQLKYKYRPPNTCSRVGGGTNSMCSGDYYIGIDFIFTVNSSGKATVSAANTNGETPPRHSVVRDCG
jgi:RHS repeat-associated protein